MLRLALRIFDFTLGILFVGAALLWGTLLFLTVAVLIMAVVSSGTGEEVKIGTGDGQFELRVKVEGRD